MINKIIVIGTSAGGLSALRRVFSQLESDLPAAVFVAYHTSPQSRYVVPMLSKNSVLPIESAANGQFREGTIYIAPPDQHLTLEPGTMSVRSGPKVNLSRPSIDVLFRSAALAYRDIVIGVVLTGMLDDGTAGLYFIKRHGGTAIVQDPDDAQFKGMPESALNNVAVDYKLPLNKIAPMLNQLARTQQPTKPPETSPPLPHTNMLDLIKNQDEHSVEASNLSCPECNGPLMRVRDGSPPRYRCIVGHAYGLASADLCAK
jgi:two-component system chemotaxis response regulator CheB